MHSVRLKRLISHKENRSFSTLTSKNPQTNTLNTKTNYQNSHAAFSSIGFKDPQTDKNQTDYISNRLS